MKQLMADLPAPRVRSAEPFEECGVDYAGPFDVKSYAGRGTRVTKAYVAVFVCLASKAVWLEPVTTLTSEGCLWAVSRLVARWPAVRVMHSDNGRNFVGAANELNRIHQAWCSKEVVDGMAMRGISWKFITPRAPSHGGLWEAAVKSFKHHLHAVMGRNSLTYEEFDTLLKRISAILNSRPLVAPTSDIRDYTVLTPGHLANGRPTVAPLGPPPEQADAGIIEWSKLRLKEQEFWERWRKDYLLTLLNRTKWARMRANLEVGDLVMIKEDDTPPGNWKRGRVEKVLPSQDGLVRSAMVRTASGPKARPIVKLVRLPVRAEAAGYFDELFQLESTQDADKPDTGFP